MQKEMQKVTINIPKEDYLKYKENLRKEGKIVTYDIIAYIKSVNERFENKE